MAGTRRSRFKGYLFVDIDGSMPRWEKKPAAMDAALGRYRKIVRDCAARAGGEVRDHVGDGVFVAFAAGNPLSAAIEMQRAVQAQNWQSVGGLSIRIGVHAADAGANEQAAINRAFRIVGAACAGQIVVSAEVMQFCAPPSEATAVDLGACYLRGVEEPLHLLSLIHPAMERREFPPLRSLAAYNATIPTQSSPLFGRSTELGDLETLMRESRLITVTGHPGAGKTRLIIEAANATAAQKRVYFIQSLSAAEGAVAAIARALEFPFHGAATHEEQLAGYLRAKKSIIVLDDPDRVAFADGVIERLLSACPDLQVLSAARAPLELAGERVYRLGGLNYGAGDAESAISSAAGLYFTHEAKRFDAAFELNKRNAADFRDLCEALAGSPLGLQLAAPWCRLLTLGAIVARLSDASAGNHSDLPGPRQQLIAAIEESIRDLDPTHHSALAKLSVFESDFDSAAAEFVAQAPVNVLKGLDDRNLIERVGETRFKLHPLICEHARRHLEREGDQATRRRHADYFLLLLERAGRIPDQSVRLNSIHAEMPNIKRAWPFALQSGDDWIWRVGEHLLYAMAMRASFRKGEALFAEPAPAGEPQLYLDAMRANCLVHQSRLESAETLAEAALQEATRPVTIAHALQALGNIAHIRGDSAVARERYLRALSLREAERDVPGAQYSALSLVLLSVLEGDMASARASVEPLYMHYRVHDDLNGLMQAHGIAGDIALKEERFADACHNYGNALAIEPRLFNPQARATLLTRLSTALLRLDRLAESKRCGGEALDIAEEMGDVRLGAQALVGLSYAHSRAGDFAEAKNALLFAVRQSLALRSKYFLRSALDELSTVEARLGNVEMAARLRGILDECDDEDTLNASDEAAAYIVSQSASLMDQYARELDISTLRL
jgi:predicted ATPase